MSNISRLFQYVSIFFVIKRNVEKDVDTCHSPPGKEDYTSKFIEIIMI